MNEVFLCIDQFIVYPFYTKSDIYLKVFFRMAVGNNVSSESSKISLIHEMLLSLLLFGSFGLLHQASQLTFRHVAVHELLHRTDAVFHYHRCSLVVLLQHAICVDLLFASTASNVRGFSPGDEDFRGCHTRFPDQ